MNTETYGPYSTIRKAGGLYFFAGQVGVDPVSKTASHDFSDQMTQALKNIDTTLKQNKLSRHSVVNSRVYLTHMSDFKKMNELYGDFFGEYPPTRECVGVRELPPVAGEVPLLVEISVIVQGSDDK